MGCVVGRDKKRDGKKGVERREKGEKSKKAEEGKNELEKRRQEKETSDKWV